MTDSNLVSLSARGVALLLDVTDRALPRLLHWGADPGLGEDDGPAVRMALATDRPPNPAGLVPFQGEGWFGRPVLAGHRAGNVRPPRFDLTAPPTVAAGEGPGADGGSIEIRAADTVGGLELVCRIEMTQHGVIRLRHRLTNTAQSTYTLDQFMCVLPLPATAVELLDFTGRWARERFPQRAPLRHGVWSRENRRGRTGFDAGALIAGSAGFAFRHGQVWGAHVAWSGNHVHYAEQLADGTSVLGGGELLEAGEIRLALGESYQTPWVYFHTSDAGLDGFSQGFHEALRSRPHHPRTPRPVTVNTWEGMYFAQTPQRVLALAEAAAAVGAERFVVDDGWFRGRRNDRAGLGDWYVDKDVWPQGLASLAEQIHGLGMQFGLWFEPEMANPDSDLVRAHPDWLLSDPDRLPLEIRHQHVLDIARPEAYAYVLERISSLIGEIGIDYLKWDHNRDLAAAVHDGRPGVHVQTQAVYRLLGELRSRHPGLEIESCSSGGARVDLGILEHTDRIWASDNLDPLVRQSVQRWTSLLIPYELIGTHVGSAPSHISGRATGIAFRCATALFGHTGIEADLTAWPQDDLAAVRAAVQTYKRLRPLLHTGAVVRMDHPDPSAWVHGVVSQDRAHAVFAYVQLETSATATGAAMRFAGLDPRRHYQLDVIPQLSAAADTWPTWANHEPLSLPGSLLSQVGVAPPHLMDRPEQAFVVELTARQV
ncbi:MAG TPA: alpha-galactosidase [Actinocrinis sp.]|nr:alpha-galactosidase [Actinocrinis sp.]